MSKSVTGIASLAECIRARELGHVMHENLQPLSDEQAADQFFSKGKFESAAERYDPLCEGNPRAQAKRGWCLASLDRFAEALPLLREDNSGKTSSEIAMLAAVIAGGWNGQLLRGFGNATIEKERKKRKKKVDVLIKQALESDHPSPLAYLAYKEIVARYSNTDEDFAIASSGLARFPNLMFLIDWNACLLRRRGTPSPTLLDQLLEAVDSSQPWEYIQEAFDTAVALNRYADADRVIDAMTRLIEASDTATDLLMLQLDVLRCALDYQRATDADPGSATNGLERIKLKIDPMLASDTEAFARSGHSVAQIRLALAIVANKTETISSAAKTLFSMAFHHPEGFGLDDFEMPHLTVYDPSGYLLLRCITRLDIRDHAAVVAKTLNGDEVEQWEVMLALDLMTSSDSPDIKTVNTLVSLGEKWAPASEWPRVLDAYFQIDPPRWRDAGRFLVRCTVKSIDEEDELSLPDTDTLSIAHLDELTDGMLEEISYAPTNGAETFARLVTPLCSALYEKQCYLSLQRFADAVANQNPTSDAIFYAALGHQKLQHLSEAKLRYEQLLERYPNNSSAYWNLLLIYQDTADLAGVKKLIPVLASKRKSDKGDWIKTHDLAMEVDEKISKKTAEQALREAVNSELQQSKPLRSDTIELSELTLLQAITLVALLRACDLDHTSWTLAPYGVGKVSFEPTDKFYQAQFDLVNLGVLRVSESTPLAAFGLRDGRVTYKLAQMRWGISPQTLELQRTIRDTSPANWPKAWRVQVETLARDMGVEECVAYLNHLALERNLDPPSIGDIRPIYRGLLEHVSVAKCWYFTFLGVQSANDYKSKYPVSRTQVTARMLKLIQEKGERGIAGGWETQYRRIAEMPRSHLIAAFHDVLTGWGERAFDEPIHELAKVTFPPAKKVTRKSRKSSVDKKSE